MLTAIARVREYGENKHGRANWKEGFPVTESLDAALRHIYDFLAGDTLDRETGFSNLWHAACQLEHAIRDMEVDASLDDRPLTKPSNRDKV